MEVEWNSNSYDKYAAEASPQHQTNKQDVDNTKRRCQ